MRELLIRFGGPIAGFLVGAGLQLSGIESLALAMTCWIIAAFWAVIAAVTWEPIRRRFVFLAFGRETVRDRPLRPETGGSPDLEDQLRQGQDLLGNGEPEIYERWTSYTANLVEQQLGHDRMLWFVGDEGYGENGMAAMVGRLFELLEAKDPND